MRVLIVVLAPLPAVLAALPVIADIRAAHRDAVIDWVVEPSLAALVRRVEGIGEVIEWKPTAGAAARREFAARLQRDAYDAVFDLQGSARAAWIARGARGRSYGIGGAGLLSPARWLVDLAITLPASLAGVERARAVVARVLGTSAQGAPNYGLGRAIPAGARRPTVVFALGATAGQQGWPEARWVALGRRLVEDGWQIALPPADDFQLERAEGLAAAIDRQVTAFLDTSVGAGAVVQVWPRDDVAMMVERLAGTHGAICEDGLLAQLVAVLGLPQLRLATAPPAGIDDVQQRWRELLAHR